MQTDTFIRKWSPSKNQELHRCGDGIYIRGFLSGRKLFQIRLSINGKRRWINVGDYPKRTLADARKIAMATKLAMKSGEVSEDRLQAAGLRTKAANKLEVELSRSNDDNASRLGIPTFHQAFRDWYRLQLRANTWRNKVSARFPLSSYQTHLEKHIGNLRIDKITRPMIKQIMQPLFVSNSETARKLLGYMHKVFEVACDNELIIGNPCPKKESFTVPNHKVQHSASLHFERLPEIWEWLAEAPYSASVKIAMQLAVVTAHRAAVIAHMRWQDFECEKGIWTIPKAPAGLSEGFMKSGDSLSLKLPSDLSTAICALPRKCDYVFTVDGLKPINAETLRRNFQKFDKITTDGFRNTFKTWALNQEPSINTFLVDRYYDHGLKGNDKNYRRDDLFEKRAELTERYYDYCKGFEWFLRRSRV